MPFLLLIIAAWAAGAAGAEPLRLPLACTPGQNCWVQNWVDADPGPGRADPACGPLTYDGHDGIDIRVPYPAMRTGVAVLAPGAGVIKGLRNDAPEEGPVPEGRACGNGVVIDHGAGLETQLCHMARGSVSVAVGDRVAAGQPVGRVGLSGKTEFPHVHLAIRRAGKAIDPFTDEAVGAGQCRLGAAAGAGPLADLPPYLGSAIVALGFSESPPADAGRADRLPQATGANTAPALVGYAIVMGPRTGAETSIALRGPDGAEIAANRIAHVKDQAQYGLFSGRKRPPAGWPAGVYTLVVRHRQADGVTLTREARLTVR